MLTEDQTKELKEYKEPGNKPMCTGRFTFIMSWALELSREKIQSMVLGKFVKQL